MELQQHDAIAKELTPIAVKKSTAASDELFTLGLDPYVATWSSSAGLQGVSLLVPVLLSP